MCVVCGHVCVIATILLSNVWLPYSARDVVAHFN